MPLGPEQGRVVGGDLNGGGLAAGGSGFVVTGGEGDRVCGVEGNVPELLLLLELVASVVN